MDFSVKGQTNPLTVLLYSRFSGAQLA
jgi:hypothetical protein